MPNTPRRNIWKKSIATFALGIIAIPLLSACGPTKSADDATDKKPAKVGKIVFGESVTPVDPKTNNGRPLKLVKPHTSFKPDTPFVYLALAEEPFGTSPVNAVWTTVTPGGEATVMVQQQVEITEPAEHRNLTADWDKASELMDEWAAGKYKLQILRGTAVMAEGVFTYEGS